MKRVHLKGRGGLYLALGNGINGWTGMITNVGMYVNYDKLYVSPWPSHEADIC